MSIFFLVNKHFLSRLKTGYLMYANGVTYPVTSVNFDLEEVTRERTPPDRYSFTFEAGTFIIITLSVI